jgi:SulP family sulfate permease
MMREPPRDAILAGEGVPPYARSDLRADALAGLTVAVMGVPQAMAYAMIADLPPGYGLYTAIVPCIVAALLGSSRHLVSGPTNASCMVIFSLISDVHSGADADPLEIVLLLTFLTGTIKLTFGVLRLGGVMRYVSNSVVVGFTAGAGILIAANQIKNVLGIPLPGGHPGRFHDVLLETMRHVPETNLLALLIGVVTAALAVTLPRINRRLPGALLGIVVTGAVAYALGWHEAARGASKIEIVRDIEPIRGNLLEMFHLPRHLLTPDWGLVRGLSDGALALAILGLIEAASSARAVASASGQRLDFSREFVGQGVSNLAGSFFSCFAGSGSFTRTAVCYGSGGRTRMAAVFSALWTALTVLLLAPFANYIPKSALAGILIVVAFSMIGKHRFRLTWKSGGKSRFVLVGTLAATLVLPLEYAIFVGVLLSIGVLLKITGKADLTHLVPRSDSGFDEVPFSRAAPSPVVAINLEGDLYFAAVEDLDYELVRCLTPLTRVVVLRMKRLRAVGSTAMAILEHFWELLRQRGVSLVVSGIEDELKQVMTGSGLRERIGEENIFYADNRLFQSTELAHARAWSIVDSESRDLRGEGEDIAPPVTPEITAADLLSPRCIRFGIQHQLREATWLMSEMQRHFESSASQPLFLQDREGRLAGSLSTSRLVRELIRDLEPEQLSELEDAELGPLFRRRFAESIRGMARTDLPRLSRATTLTELVSVLRKEDLTLLPVCGEDGRLVGFVTPIALLDGLVRRLDATDGGGTTRG